MNFDNFKIYVERKIDPDKIHCHAFECTKIN